MAVRNDFIKFTDKESTELKEFFDSLSNIDVDLFGDDVIKFHINIFDDSYMSLSKVKREGNKKSSTKWSIVTVEWKNPTPKNKNQRVLTLEFPTLFDMLDWLKKYSNFIKICQNKEVL